MILRRTAIAILAGAAASLAPFRVPGAPIQPWAQNPWYWSVDGAPVLLIGGSDDDNLFQWPEDRLKEQLDRLAAVGGNVIRNTMSDRKDRGFECYPFLRLNNGLYDLNQWNPEYWTRFERLLEETERRGIFVQIEVWDRFDYTDNRASGRWQIHPYNPKNNVNYTYQESGFAETYPDHPGANKQPFFFTTPRQRNNQVVLPYQQRFVRRLLDAALKRDNALYCVDNETKAEEEWARYWATFIKTHAAQAGVSVSVTEMWDDWDLRADRHRRTFDHPELYDFVDVSQNNHNKGQKHWDNFLHVRAYLSARPRPINTTKTYGATGNKFGHTDQDGVERFWRHLLAGAASARFHRPDSGLGLNAKAAASVAAARALHERIPLWTVEPMNALLIERQPNAAYLAARPGEAYAVYLPRGGDAILNLEAASSRFELQWLDIDAGQWRDKTSVLGGGRVRIAAPGSGNWVAALVRAAAKPSR